MKFKDEVVSFVLIHESLTPHSAAMSWESHHCEGGYLQELTNLPLHLLSEHTAKSSTDSLKPNMIPVHQLALISEWKWVVSYIFNSLPLTPVLHFDWCRYVTSVKSGKTLHRKWFHYGIIITLLPYHEEDCTENINMNWLSAVLQKLKIAYWNFSLINYIYFLKLKWLYIYQINY